MKNDRTYVEKYIQDIIKKNYLLYTHSEYHLSSIYLISISLILIKLAGL